MTLGELHDLLNALRAAEAERDWAYGVWQRDEYTRGNAAKQRHYLDCKTRVEELRDAPIALTS